MSGKRGKLVVISASSGAGKTTVCRELIRHDPDLRFSVSCTSRQPRDNEIEGKDYFFISKDEFLRKIESGDFVEWEEIYGDYYGTLKNSVESALRKAEILLLDIDVKGGLSIKKAFPSDTISIFLKTSSPDELLKRLKKRGTENELSLKKRIERFKEEEKLSDNFDYIIINDNLEETVKRIYKIIKGDNDGN